MLRKTNRRLEQAVFTFGAGGDIETVQLVVAFDIEEDGAHLDHIRQTKDAYPDLTQAQRAQANAIGQRLQLLASNF